MCYCVAITKTFYHGSSFCVKLRTFERHYSYQCTYLTLLHAKSSMSRHENQNRSKTHLMGFNNLKGIHFGNKFLKITLFFSD